MYIYLFIWGGLMYELFAGKKNLINMQPVIVHFLLEIIILLTMFHLVILFLGQSVNQLYTVH